MAEGLQRRRQMRSGHCALVTFLLHQVSELIEGGSPKGKASEAFVIKLKQYKISLQETLGTLEELDNQILEYVKEEELEGEIFESDDVRERIHFTVMTIDAAIQAL